MCGQLSFGNRPARICPLERFLRVLRRRGDAPPFLRRPVKAGVLAHIVCRLSRRHFAILRQGPAPGEAGGAGGHVAGGGSKAGGRLRSLERAQHDTCIAVHCYWPQGARCERLEAPSRTLLASSC